MTTSDQSEGTSRSLGDDQNSDTSLETTVPTDLTISPVSEAKHDPSRMRTTYSSNATALLDKKRLLHDIHLQKIEIAQKNHLIQNLRTELILKTEELREQLSDAVREKDILKSRYEIQLKFAEESAKRRETSLKNDIKEILDKQKSLEEINAKLEEQINDFKGSLHDFELSESQFKALTTKDEAELNLKSFVSLRVFKLIQPLKQEIARGKEYSEALKAETEKCRDEIARLQQELAEKASLYNQLKETKEKADSEVNKLKSQIKHGDYAVENFDHVKRERDEFEKVLTETLARLKSTEAALHVVEEERNDYKSDVGILQRRLALVDQDCAMLQRQATELSRQLTTEKERSSKLLLSAESARQSQESTYTQYINARNRYKAEYELRLQQEVENVRKEMTQNFERIKTKSQQLYEQEIQSLREAKELALLQKTQLESKVQELESKYEETFSGSTKRVGELQKKVEELEKHLLLAETQLEDALKQLSSVNNILSLTKQANLRNTTLLAEKDTELRKKSHKLEALQVRVDQLMAEREELLTMQTKLALDLKKVLSQRDELNSLKELVTNLCNETEMKTTRGKSRMKT